METTEGGNDGGSDGGGNDGGGNDGGGRPPASPIEDVLLLDPTDDQPVRLGTAGQGVTASVFWLGFTPGAGPADGLLVEFGLGPENANPSTSPDGFAWTTASYAGDGEATGSGGAMTHDLFSAALNSDDLGTYRMALRVRFGLDSPWVYGDVSGQPDFDVGELPRLTFTSDR
ncbi:MAG: hypothetical protein AAF658_12225 [Myxococcota bacterium]